MVVDLETGVVINVEYRGWAGDPFYIVQNGEKLPIEMDAYQAGSGLLQPGDTISFPKSAPLTAVSVA